MPFNNESYNELPSSKLLMIQSVTPPGVEKLLINSSLFPDGISFSHLEASYLKTGKSSDILRTASLFSSELGSTLQ